MTRLALPTKELLRELALRAIDKLEALGTKLAAQDKKAKR